MAGMPWNDNSNLPDKLAGKQAKPASHNQKQATEAKRSEHSEIKKPSVINPPIRTRNQTKNFNSQGGEAKDASHDIAKIGMIERVCVVACTWLGGSPGFLPAPGEEPTPPSRRERTKKTRHFHSRFPNLGTGTRQVPSRLRGLDPPVRRLNLGPDHHIGCWSSEQVARASKSRFLGLTSLHECHGLLFAIHGRLTRHNLNKCIERLGMIIHDCDQCHRSGEHEDN